MKTKYLIIGNSAGGIGAVEAIREINAESAIAIIAEESYPAYSRPLISKYLAGTCNLDEIRFRPADFYTQNRVELVSGQKAVSIDATARTVTLSDGAVLEYEKLLVATGGKPIIPKMEGTDKKGIFNFITLQDAMSVEAYLPEVKKAVVIGGGLIGISATEALVKKGITVTVVEMKGHLLNTILDEKAAILPEAAVKRAGVSILTGRTVAEITGSERVSGVRFDNNTSQEADMVVVAVGVMPRIELAQSAGLKVNRGIVVDKYMMTSAADVYACGDACEAYDYVYASGRLSPIWPNAYIGGRVAGYNMAGLENEYRGGTAMNSLTYFGLELATAGMASPPTEQGYEVFTSETTSGYHKIVINPDGKLVGLTVVGNIERAGIIFGLMRDRVDVRAFKTSILNEDFGLAYLPPAVMAERLTGATRGRVRLEPK